MKESTELKIWNILQAISNVCNTLCTFFTEMVNKNFFLFFAEFVLLLCGWIALGVGICALHGVTVFCAILSILAGYVIHYGYKFYLKLKVKYGTKEERN